jgi:hypothetical protein
MFLAVGNPDSGANSELMRALNEAVRSGNEERARQLADQVLAELERGRQSAAAASAWQPGSATMLQLDRVLVAYEAMVQAKVQGAGGEPSAPDPEDAFRVAGGLDAWGAMFEAAQGVVAARPTGAPPHQCEGVPISW